MSAADRLAQIEARHLAPESYRRLAAHGNATCEITDAEAYTNALAATADDVPALVAAVRAALEVHQPIDAVNFGGRTPRQTRVCTGCGQDDGNWQTWPCRTVRAIEARLGGDR